MSNNGEFIFFWVWLFFFVIMVAVMLSLYHSYHQKETKMWEGVVNRTGLILKPRKLFNRAKVEGQYRNYNAIVTTIHSRPVKLFLAVTVKNPQAMDFSMEQHGTVTSIFQSKEAKIQMGDQRFDRLFLVKGFPEDKVRNIFSAEGIGKRLVRANWRGYTTLKFEGEHLQLIQRFSPTYDDLDKHLHHLLDLLIDIAEIIENERQSSEENVV